jgi:hypothetical protein
MSQKFVTLKDGGPLNLQGSTVQRSRLAHADMLKERFYLDEND